MDWYDTSRSWVQAYVHSSQATEEQPGDPNADKFEDRTGKEETYAFKGGDVPIKERIEKMKWRMKFLTNSGNF